MGNYIKSENKLSSIYKYYWLKKKLNRKNIAC